MSHDFPLFYTALIHDSPLDQIAVSRIRASLYTAPSKSIMSEKNLPAEEYSAESYFTAV
jgi:hypothetical protein